MFMAAAVVVVLLVRFGCWHTRQVVSVLSVLLRSFAGYRRQSRTPYGDTVSVCYLMTKMSHTGTAVQMVAHMVAGALPAKVPKKQCPCVLVLC
uniref:Putative secreted protein n=1 Tax=Anopheles triannulatus TaxID=58253 RepID=A0A2M4B388_9DIPT